MAPRGTALRPVLLALAVAAAAVYCVPEFDSRVEPATRRSQRRSRTRPITPPGMPRFAPQPGAPGTALPQPPPAGTGALGAPRLRVTFIDVGQGDAALLESGDGHAAMIDVGPPEARGHVAEVLAAHGVARLDWVMFSHPHLDHIGGGTHLLGRVRVGFVVDPAVPHPIATYERLLARIQDLGLGFVRGRTNTPLSLGAAVGVEVLQPHEPLLTGTRSDVNSNSIVARVTAGAVRVLFTGDAEAETEHRLLAENAAQLPADVLKVAHHGSRYASSAEFVGAVAPRYAVISCGPNNEYGHPGASTLATLAQRDARVFRTDLQGDVAMTTDGARLQFATTRAADAAQMATPGVARRRRGGGDN